MTMNLDLGQTSEKTDIVVNPKNLKGLDVRSLVPGLWHCWE